MHARVVTDSFRRAAIDYFYLIERSYARGSALKLVGDRHQLNSTQRSMLYRGVASSEQVASRACKLTDRIDSLPVSIDGLNVLYTLANYLYGKVLYIATDGWLRDAAERHGASPGMSPKRGQKLAAAVSLMIEWLIERRPARVEVYLDEPVSLSGRLAADLRLRLAGAKLVGTAKTVRSADYALKRVRDAVLATSDSTIIDGGHCLVCDMAHQILACRFAPDFVDLRDIVRSNGEGEMQV